MEKNKASVRRMMDGKNLKQISDLGVPIPAVDMEMTYRGEKYRLSMKQVKELREAYAREFDDAITKVQMIPRWSEYSKEFRKEQMQKALNQASKRARRFIDKPVDGE
jgi:formiminotetrahydrofolate cyclodeaminase